MPIDWKCPFCDRHTTVTDNDYSSSEHDLLIKNKNGNMRLRTLYIVCPNPNCKEYELTALLSKIDVKWAGTHSQKTVKAHVDRWSLVPRSHAQALPSYIPEAIRSDYSEACLIQELSPKASATLSRRCIQGILRDFWSVKPARLVDEIKEIKPKIDPLTWEAIDAVRKVGNIGAHMEADINLMVDVEPNEAALLTGLIETLLKEWYVNREERRKQLTAITALAAQKADEKKGTTTAT